MGTGVAGGIVVRTCKLRTKYWSTQIPYSLGPEVTKSTQLTHTMCSAENDAEPLACGYLVGPAAAFGPRPRSVAVSVSFDFLTSCRWFLYYIMMTKRPAEPPPRSPRLARRSKMTRSQQRREPPPLVERSLERQGSETTHASI